MHGNVPTNQQDAEDVMQEVFALLWNPPRTRETEGAYQALT